MTDCVLLDHIATVRRRERVRLEKPPTVLALGRWDVRELARVVARIMGHPKPSSYLRELRGCEGLRFEVDAAPFTVRVDARIGRMPGALWWHP